MSTVYVLSTDDLLPLRLISKFWDPLSQPTMLVRGNADFEFLQMHSKLQLLGHPTHLRVVVPSANLVASDWDETGVMENVCCPQSLH